MRPASHPAAVLERQLASAIVTGHHAKATELADRLKAEFGVRSSQVEEWATVVYDYDDTVSRSGYGQSPEQYWLLAESGQL